MAVIELGTVPGDDAPVPPAARPPLPRRTIRQIAAVVVGVLCLAALHASVVPRPHGLGRAWSMPFADADSFETAGGSLFVLRDGSPQTLAAYAITDGGLRWSRRVSYTVTSMDVAAAAGVLLLPADAYSAETRTPGGDILWTRYSTQVVALDMGTGRELWRAPGDIALAAADGVLLVEHQPNGIGASRLHLVRPRDGRTLWTRPGAGAYRWAVVGGRPGSPARLVTATPTGDLRVYRFADGVDVARARVPWRVGTLTDGTYSELAARDDLLYVFTNGHAASTVAAYAPDTLTRRWTLTSPAGGGPAPCGAVLCVPTSSGFAARDWLTGAELWRIRGYDLGRPLVGGLLLVGGEDSGRAIVDDRTGRLVAGLGAGGAAWNSDSGTIVTLEPTRSPPARTAVARLDPPTGEVFLLGTIDPVVNSFWCRLSGPRLACTTPRGLLTVTELS